MIRYNLRLDLVHVSNNKQTTPRDNSYQGSFLSIYLYFLPRTSA